MAITLDLNGAVNGDGFNTSYTEQAPGVAITSGATVTGLGNGKKVTEIKVQITSNAADGDLLSIDPLLLPGITRSWNSSTKTLTIGNNGVADSSELLTLLNAVRFSSTGEGASAQKTLTVSALGSGNEGSDSAFSLIGYVAINDAPIAVADTFLQLSGSSVYSLNVLANDTDADTPSPLTITNLTQPANGTVAIVDGKVLYTPNAGFSGPDSFTYKTSDGNSTSNAATVSVSVVASNSAPTTAAAVESGSGNEDTTLSGQLLAGSDLDGDALTFLLESGAPAGLTLSETGAWSWTPPANYNGSTSFGYRVSDGTLTSAVKTVSLTVAAVNDAPLAAAATEGGSGDEDTTLSGQLLAGSDVDGDALTFLLESGAPAGLTLSETGAWSWTPPANYNGSTSFSYRVSDGTVPSAAKTVSLTVNSINDAPTLASAVGGGFDENRSGAETPIEVGSLSGSDVDAGDTVSFVFADTGSSISGNFKIVDGKVFYTGPALDFETDPQSFTLSVAAFDGAAQSATRDITVTLGNVNEAPTDVTFANALGTIDENTNTASRVKVADLSVVDDALGTNLYSLSGADAESFEIDGSSLYLKSGVTLDFESKSDYAVTVDVDDAGVGGTPDASRAFTLSVNDVNEKSTLSPIGPKTIAENTSDLLGGVLIATLAATDPDAGQTATLSYLFANGTDQSGDFRIIGNEVRYFGAAFDFEYLPARISLSLQSRDSGGLTSDVVTFAVGVTNQFENLFSVATDGVVNFNTVPLGSFDPGTQYNGLSGDDLIVLPNIERVQAGLNWDFNRTFEGDSGDDRIQGGNGDDIVAGGSGWDVIFGGEGADRIIGGAGNDIINGGANSATDGDKLTGGSGNDVFLFQSALDIGKKSGPHDVINDFAIGFDKIDLSSVFDGPVTFKTATSAANAALLAGGANAAANTVIIYVENGKTWVVGNSNQVAGIDFELELSGALKLTSKDFIGATSAIITDQSSWNSHFGGSNNAPSFADLHDGVLL